MISSFKDRDTEELYEKGASRRNGGTVRKKKLIHPGEILLEEFLVPMGISQNRLALDIRVPAPRVNAIVRGKRAITADTALRLGQYFKMEPQFWLNLQSNYDLGVAESGVWSKVKKFIPQFVPEKLSAACL